MRRLFILLAILLPITATADSALPFMRDLAGDIELPRPLGLSIDFYTMDQDYEIADLQFVLPGVSLSDPTQITATNEVVHFDIKADAWIFPFLNVFGLVGKVNTDTTVDFSKAEIEGLPFDLGKLPVDYDGTVYGGGFTLVYGTENWFTSATTAFTRTSISGDFESSVHSLSIQPRIGLIRGGWTYWAGALYLDVDETHKGAIELPYIGDVPFAVDLVTMDHWNYAAGAGYYFSDRANLSLEVGFGNRTHTLFNFNVRF